MMPALQACLDYFEGRIYPGDIFISNDPYEGGSHLPDIFLFKPIFAGDRIVAHLCAMAHHTDIGGRVAGGNACDSTEIYQEGLRIPPLKLRERGEENETIVRILEKAVRVPDKVLGDLRGQQAALFYGEREYNKLVERYGVDGLESSITQLLDYTEELTRKSIAAMPDGTWTFSDFVDNDGFERRADRDCRNRHQTGRTDCSGLYRHLDAVSGRHPAGVRHHQSHGVCRVAIGSRRRYTEHVRVFPPRSASLPPKGLLSTQCPPRR